MAPTSAPTSASTYTNKTKDEKQHQALYLIFIFFYDFKLSTDEEYWLYLYDDMCVRQATCSGPAALCVYTQNCTIRSLFVSPEKRTIEEKKVVIFRGQI